MFKGLKQSVVVMAAFAAKTASAATPSVLHQKVSAVGTTGMAVVNKLSSAPSAFANLSDGNSLMLLGTVFLGCAGVMSLLRRHSA